MTIASDLGFVVGETYRVSRIDEQDEEAGIKVGDEVVFHLDTRDTSPWFLHNGRKVSLYVTRFRDNAPQVFASKPAPCIPDVETGPEKFDPPREYILTHYNEKTRYRAVTRLDVVEGILFVYYGDEDLDIYKDWQGITAV